MAIMQARLDLAVQKRCDGVEPDNVDGYANDTGFDLSSLDQLTYNQWLASEAHTRNLSIGLKNDLDQVPALVRPGIAIYGVSPGGELGPPEQYGLVPAMTLRARLAHVKRVPAVAIAALALAGLPLYFAGRTEAMVWGPLAALVALLLAELQSPMRWIAAGPYVGLGLATAGLWLAALPVRPPAPGVEVGRALAPMIEAQDRVVVAGLWQLELQHGLAEAGTETGPAGRSPVVVETIPRSQAGHPGWLDRQSLLSPRLLDVLCGLQNWLAFNGHRHPIHVNSGYRTFSTNYRTEGSALSSRHLNGQAADITVPGVQLARVAGMASLFGEGGVGMYLNKGFVHVDTGNERIWIK